VSAGTPSALTHGRGSEWPKASFGAATGVVEETASVATGVAGIRTRPGTSAAAPPAALGRAMSILSGLQSKYENMLVSFDAKDREELSVDVFKRCLLQGEWRQVVNSRSTKRIGDMALVGANYRGQGRRSHLSKIEFDYCYKFGHISQDCSVVKANRKSKDKVTAIAAEDGSDINDVICLISNAADNYDISISSLLDSAASANMC